MRVFALAKQTDGINRMRSKGGASDSALFDLQNGWVSAKGVIQARPGSRKVLAFPAGTICVFGHQGKYHTFAAAPTFNADPRVVVNVLRHPTGGSAALLRIHNVFPVLGRLYVVAEFADAVVQHYWLDLPAAWTANTVLGYGYRVQPVAGSETGYYYRATNIDTSPAWTASTVKAVGNFVQPSAANNFRYEATAVSGATPSMTSSVEPTWPTTDGATVTERRYASEPGIDPGSSKPPPPTTPPGSPGDYTPYPPKTTTGTGRTSTGLVN